MSATAPVARHEITGLILAGGKGSRMGGADKGLIDIDGKPLIAHVSERLRPQVARVLIGLNRNAERYRMYADGLITDNGSDSAPAFEGPVAGVLAALRVNALPWVAVVPCDAPRLPHDLVERLAENLDGASAAVVTTNGQWQPTFCLLSCSTANTLESLFTQGLRSLHAVLQAISATSVAFADADAFLNLNTPADLQSARRA